MTLLDDVSLFKENAYLNSEFTLSIYAGVLLEKENYVLKTRFIPISFDDSTRTHSTKHDDQCKILTLSPVK